MNKKRYLLKISGEVIKGSLSSGISWEATDVFCKRISSIINSGVELGIVVGGGNIFRGASGNIESYDRLIGDNIGMMATVVNGLALVERLKAQGIKAILQSGISIDGIATLFNIDNVTETFEKEGVVVFCGGIGNPYFSTDTTAVLRALQIKASCVFKATKVNGIYDKDPKIYKDAEFYQTIGFDEMIEKKLEIMDLTSVLLMKKNNMKLMVFDMNERNALENACKGQKVGSYVEN